MPPTSPLAARVVIAALGSLVAASAAAQTGTLRGRVEATPAKYLPETVVYVKQAPGSFAPKKVEMDQKALTFIPHLLVVTKGDTVRFLNHDSVAHNVYSPDGEPYNLGTFKPEEERERLFAQEGVYTQLCSIHPEMIAYVFVGQNPYAAAVDARGSFEIKGVPPGTYKLAVWNSHLKAGEQTVTVAAGKTVEARFSLKR